MTGTPDAESLAATILEREPHAGDVRLVCIDGPSGSGKTTLASALAAVLEHTVGHVPVVHGDDVYEDWPVVATASDPVRAFEVLGEDLVRSLVVPWTAGLDGTHRVWDWRAGSWAAPRSVPPAPVVLLEGVGLGGAALRPFASLVIWLDADPVARVARVVERDGPEVAAHLDEWRAGEDAWHAADRTAAHAHIRLRTG